MRQAVKNIFAIRAINFVRKKMFDLTFHDHQQYYNYLSVQDLKNKKKSDCLFIFGSAFSLNSISDEEYHMMMKYDTFSFNQFIRQDFINLDFYLIREIGGMTRDSVKLSNKAYENFYREVRRDRYKNTTFLLQGDLTGDVSIEVQHRFILPENSSLYIYSTYSRKPWTLPPKNIEDGLIHRGGTLGDAISFSYSMGYKKVVLVGVDLYDRRYFWLREDETRIEDEWRGANKSAVHNTANSMISTIKRWKKHLESSGLQLEVYNPKSLLTQVLPVFEFESLRQ